MKDFGRLLRIIAPVWPWMLAASLLALAASASNIGLMSSAAYLIAAAALQPPLSALSVAIVGVRFFGLSRAVFRYIERYAAHNATFHLLSQLRVWFYVSLEPLSLTSLAGFRSGELMNSIVNDVETLKYFYLRVILPPAVAVLALGGMAMLLSGFGSVFVYLIAGGFLFTGLLLPLSIYFLGRGTGYQLVKARGQLNTILVDSVRGLRDLTAFDQTGPQIRQLEAINEKYTRLQCRIANLAAMADACGNLIMNLTTAGVLALAIPMVERNRLDGVYLALLGLGVQSSFEAVLPLTQAYRFWEESLAAAGRLFAIIEPRPVIMNQEGGLTVPANLHLEFQKVKFRYDKDQLLVLNDVSFSVPPGYRLAIVGPSSAGKSSLVSLLLRFWECENGNITLGERDITEYSPQALREIIGVVPQHTHIFNASIGDNILIARPEAGRDEVLEAIKRSALDKFISSLPQGLNTFAGANGQILSGGERQRVTIARALLKNPSILILDEITAGLDPITEKEIWDSMSELMIGRTTILITHRLTGLETMDEILVMDRGRVVERGRQKELIACKGLFYRMWHMQNDVLF